MIKQSFKLHIFLRLVGLTFAIILANRFIAHQFLENQLRAQTVQTMGYALRACLDQSNDQSTFIKCSKNLNQGILISSGMDRYVLCVPGQNHDDPHEAKICDRAHAPALVWKSHKEGFDDTHAIHADQNWQAVKLTGTPNSPRLLMNQNHMDDFMDEVWALRDRNLVYVLPTILLLLSVMSLFMVRVIMSPIRKIEAAVSAIDAKNLNQSIGVPTPFGEFHTFIGVFEDLRQRLSDSFTKARRFASDASHELRTPLAILRGNSEQLISELDKGSDAQVRASSINEEIDRLIEITEKLLLLSRADANSILEQPTQVDLSEMLTELLDEASSLQSNILVTGKIQPDVVWWGDRTLIRQLIHNLYSNALNYNIPRGWVSIRLSSQDGRLLLEIENPTANIPDHLSERAFERFYRGDASHTRQVDGLGLGLSLCEEIVKLHQGTLALQVTDQGTVRLVLNAPLKRVL